MTEPWSYAVQIRNRSTGEVRTVVVELTKAERYDALRHLAMRGENGPGGQTGPIAFGYALQHAAQVAPDGFIVDVDNVERVVLH